MTCPHCPHADHSINACPTCDCDPYRGRYGPQRTLDAVGTTGGKATVATIKPRTDSWDKIRLKGGPKQYKSGKPGPTGADRLRRRVNSLLLAATRLARKATDVEEREWAERLADALQAYAAAEFAHTTPFDVQALLEKK